MCLSLPESKGATKVVLVAAQIQRACSHLDYLLLRIFCCEKTTRFHRTHGRGYGKS